jgi:transcription initiation factor TFIID TATA-box-binding protein
VTNVEIANIVGVLNFHRELRLSSVAELLSSSDDVSSVNYSPEDNHWLQTRFEIGDKSKYVAFYRSGTCAIVGCNSFEELQQYVDLIKEVMSPVIETNPTLEIKNLVCVGELKKGIDLTHLAIAAGLEKVEYEPEQFPGLIYRAPDLPAVLLIFASGKVVVTGITSLEEADQSFSELRDRLSEWELVT